MYVCIYVCTLFVSASCLSLDLGLSVSIAWHFLRHQEQQAEQAEQNNNVKPHTNHLNRYYVDPPCLAFTGETSQTTVAGAFPGDVVTARYKLPDGLTCERCIVQMIYCESSSWCHDGFG